MKPQDGQLNDPAPTMPRHMSISQIKDHMEAQAQAQPNQKNKKTNLLANPLITETMSSQVIKPSMSAAPTSSMSTDSEPGPAVALPNTTGNAGLSPTPPLINQNVGYSNSYLAVLVALQMMALAVILLGFITPILWVNTALIVVGTLLVCFGVLLGIWAVLSFNQAVKIMPTPNKNGYLVTNGPYKYIRHPMYAALILIGSGFGLAFPTIPRLIALAVLLIVLFSKISIEENLLGKRYHHYTRYQKATNKLWPKLSRPNIDFYKLQ